jgi:hypothetical protein
MTSWRIRKPELPSEQDSVVQDEPSTPTSPVSHGKSATVPAIPVTNKQEIKTFPTVTVTGDQWSFHPKHLEINGTISSTIGPNVTLNSTTPVKSTKAVLDQSSINNANWQSSSLPPLKNATELIGNNTINLLTITRTQTIDEPSVRWQNSPVLSTLPPNGPFPLDQAGPTTGLRPVKN